MRLYYAYADALATAKRNDEAIDWFTRAGEMDAEEVLDVPDRLAELGADSNGADQDKDK